jgi:predicted HAD superfamily Cof-like phosphohydrolase
MIYENLSDAELIREADGHSGLVKALSERLEMRLRPQSVFHEQAAFMRACGQTTTEFNAEQVELYRHLIAEEYAELRHAYALDDTVEQFDAALDLIVVLIGFGLSQGWPMPEGWAEVMRSNFAKVDPLTGKVRKREDGKILKPDGWEPPDLKAVLSRPAELF